MRLAIRYVTRFLYADAVWQSQNVLRACPASDDRQRVVEYRVTTNPSARVYSYTDYWGTRVDAFGVRRPHPRLEVIAEAIVETRAPGEPRWPHDMRGRVDPRSLGAGSGAPAASVMVGGDDMNGGRRVSTIDPPRVGMCTRAALAAPDFVADHVEYLEPSPHTRWDDELRRQAEAWIAPAGTDALAGVDALFHAVGATLSYTPGATTVGVDVNALLRQRAGVCQDFAHLFIALCRSVGIPARYVSGYLLADPSDRSAEPPGGVVDVKTHAWAEVALPGAAWLPLDPTNQRPIGARHVKIGHGRDYDDVLPLRGVYHGPTEHQLDVVVRMREVL